MKRRDRRPLLIALGLLGLTAPLVVACRGVLGIHELGYDGGLDAKKDTSTSADDAADDTSDDAADDASEPDAGDDATAAQDAGSDAKADAGHDASRDAGHDAGEDAPHDAGSSLDACLSSCFTSNGPGGHDFIGAFNEAGCGCAACTTDCTGGMHCSPPPPDDTGPLPVGCQVCLAGIVIGGDCNVGPDCKSAACMTVATCIGKCKSQ